MLEKEHNHSNMVTSDTTEGRFTGVAVELLCFSADVLALRLERHRCFHPLQASFPVLHFDLSPTYDSKTGSEGFSAPLTPVSAPADRDTGTKIWSCRVYNGATYAMTR